MKSLITNPIYHSVYVSVRHFFLCAVLLLVFIIKPPSSGFVCGMHSMSIQWTTYARRFHFGDTDKTVFSHHQYAMLCVHVSVGGWLGIELMIEIVRSGHITNANIIAKVISASLASILLSAGAFVPMV